jgi:hypothetical protein
MQAKKHCFNRKESEQDLQEEVRAKWKKPLFMGRHKSAFPVFSPQIADLFHPHQCSVVVRREKYSAFPYVACDYKTDCLNLSVIGI